jgi:hypothetical protein
MTSSNAQTIRSIIQGIDAFIAGRADLDDIQSLLQACEDQFERGSLNCGEDVRLAEADLEEIRFGRLLEEQRPAAVFRLDDLRTALVRALEDRA